MIRIPSRFRLVVASVVAVALLTIVAWYFAQEAVERWIILPGALVAAIFAVSARGILSSLVISPIRRLFAKDQEQRAKSKPWWQEPLS